MSDASSRPRRFLIINAHSARNRGDGGIVLASIGLVKKAFPGAHIAVMSRYAETDHETYRVETYRPFLHFPPPPGRRPWRLAALLWSLSHCLVAQLQWLITHREGVFRFLSNQRELRVLREADVVISCGGGYLYSAHRKALHMTLLHHLYLIYAATFFGKPVVCFPQSIGPFHSSVDRFLVRRVLSRVAFICVRDEISLVECERLGLSRERYVLVPDVGFALDSNGSKRSDLQKRLPAGKQHPIVAITVSDWRWAEGGTIRDVSEKYNRYVAVVAAGIDDVVRRYDASVALVPQCILKTEGHQDDVATAQQVREMVSSRQRVLLVRDEYRPDELKSLYGLADVMVGTRMHSCIFGISEGVPCLGLAYQPKTVGLFSLIGKPELVIRAADLTPASFRDRLFYLLDNRVRLRKEFVKLAGELRERTESGCAQALKAALRGQQL